MQFETCVYRDFNTSENIKQRFNISDEDKTHELRKIYIGEISIFLLHKNQLMVQVDGLHENDDADYGARQGMLVVDYPNNIPLYDVINTILNKLTKDHHYYLHENVKYKDFILCSDELAEEHPELCNFDRMHNYTGGIWMDFTNDNLQYIKPCPIDSYHQNKNMILHKGKVDQDGTFTYDYPIVSEYVDKEYYKITRGRCVWDITYDHVNKKYGIDESWRDYVPSLT